MNIFEAINQMVEGRKVRARGFVFSYLDQGQDKETPFYRNDGLSLYFQNFVKAYSDEEFELETPKLEPTDFRKHSGFRLSSGGYITVAGDYQEFVPSFGTRKAAAQYAEGQKFTAVLSRLRHALGCEEDKWQDGVANYNLVWDTGVKCWRAHPWYRPHFPSLFYFRKEEHAQACADWLNENPEWKGGPK